MPYITPLPFPLDFAESINRRHELVEMFMEKFRKADDAKQAVRDHKLEQAREVMGETTVDNGEDQDDQKTFIEENETSLGIHEASMPEFQQ